MGEFGGLRIRYRFPIEPLFPLVIMHAAFLASLRWRQAVTRDVPVASNNKTCKRRADAESELD